MIVDVAFFRSWRPGFVILILAWILALAHFQTTSKR